MPSVFNKRKGAPVDAVYIGRPSKWGNPFIIGEHGTRYDCVRLYAEWLPTSGLDPKELKGKDLVCWCAPSKCHGDILLEEANK